MSTTLLAIDPGREKCGYAVLPPNDVHRADGCRQADAPQRGVVPTSDIVAIWREVVSRWPGVAVLVGGGTGSAAVIEALAAAGARCVVVDEHNTTRRARERYFLEQPPRGWMRLVPRVFLSPPGPVDDLAALILGEDYRAAAVLPPLGESAGRKDSEAD